MPVNNVIPMVVEQGDRSERAYDIFSLLLKGRIVMLGSEINAQTANLIVAQLLFLDREDQQAPIQIYIHSPGGEVYAGFAIYDTIQQLSAPVGTVAVGRSASFGTVILVAGRKGEAADLHLKPDIANVIRQHMLLTSIVALSSPPTVG